MKDQAREPERGRCRFGCWLLDRRNRRLTDSKDQAVALTAGRAKLEASGNVSLNNVRQIAETGVDFISVGEITHSARVLDLSLKLNQN
jgi:nicotinate-nucleotide pyrophosphorylase